ncbi:hypothetical protein GCT13_00380 [Paraburkholderia sp. CNPSo 3157]|uniref:Uncharacterized protein n=1 Tax=Paraburkholderia franconis TaxID=2654983 RepID=A0A7X1N537_9BURK|nr:hypothetical protein [Paraburkholderia franconis]MPW15409.1 hypothetical protein [Paraburkholderia franconis]
MSKRAIVSAAVGLAAACASTAAAAHVGVGVYLGPPAPVYGPPPVYYAPPPVVYAPPPPVYYGGYRGDYWRGPRWYGHGHHRGWERHHGHGRW